MMTINQGGPRSCEHRLIVLSDPTWGRRAVAVHAYLIRRNGDVDNWEAWGELLDGRRDTRRRFDVSAEDIDEEVEPEDNDAIALAVSQWCLAEFADFFLTLVDGGEEVVRPVSWSRVLSPEL
jgi:hypothetical protein